MKRLEASVYGSYNEDGLLDIVIGGTIIFFAISTLTSLSYLAAIGAPLMIIALSPIRKAVSAPRLGAVEFQDERNEKVKHQLSLAKLFFLMTLIIGVLVFFLYTKLFLLGEAERETMIAAASLPLALLLGLIALGLIGAGYQLGLKRYYLYALICLGAIALGANDVPLKQALLGAGILITAAGFLTLIIFLIRHPKIELGDMDDIS